MDNRKPLTMAAVMDELLLNSKGGVKTVYGIELPKVASPAPKTTTSNSQYLEGLAIDEKLLVEEVLAKISEEQMKGYRPGGEAYDNRNKRLPTLPAKITREESSKDYVLYLAELAAQNKLSWRERIDVSVLTGYDKKRYLAALAEQETVPWRKRLILTELAMTPYDLALNDKAKAEALAFAKPSKPSPPTPITQVSAAWNALSGTAKSGAEKTVKDAFRNRDNLTKEDVVGYATALSMPLAAFMRNFLNNKNIGSQKSGFGSSMLDNIDEKTRKKIEDEFYNKYDRFK
jgi:hypothetical protein